MPGSVAHWNTTCGSVAELVTSVIEIRAGLRCSDGRDRMRARKARPSVQAVLALKVGKRTEGEDSWAVRTVGWDC